MVIRVPCLSETCRDAFNEQIEKSELEVGPFDSSVVQDVICPNCFGKRQAISNSPPLIFDMEDVQEMNTTFRKRSLDLAPERDVIKKLGMLFESMDEQERRIHQHVRIALDEATNYGLKCLKFSDLANTLQKLNNKLQIQTALGGGYGRTCFCNLRHSFFVVTLPPISSGDTLRTLIVDPYFREQFQISQTTDRYNRILNTAPMEVVATSDRLCHIVEIICEEMAAAFSETERSLPPWRQTAAMLSKWQPQSFVAEDLSKNGNVFSGALYNAKKINARHSDPIEEEKRQNLCFSKSISTCEDTSFKRLHRIVGFYLQLENLERAAQAA